ncbi:MAG: NAD-dependent epimerase/dehydratase family protein [Dehalococcoidia bacterium]
MGISLVTGASGFLGSHIVYRLIKRGETVRALVRPTSDKTFLEDHGAELATGDVTDEPSLAAAFKGVDTVYHAAATVTDWAPWKDFATVTIGGTGNVIKAAMAVGVRRLLYVSSDAVYALRSLKEVVTEDSPLERRFGWFDYYRRSKSVAEESVRRAMKLQQIGASIVRPGLLFGERDRAIFPGMVAFLKSGTSMYIGNGRNRLPCVYAGDVAEACILAATSADAAGEIYNVASDEVVTQRDLLQAVARATGLQAPKRSLPIDVTHALAFAMQLASIASGRRLRPPVTRYGINLLARDYREDISKIRGELGWEPVVGLSEAISRTIEWSEAHRPVPASG